MPAPASPAPQPSPPENFEPENFQLAAYVQQALPLLGLSVPPEQLPSVIENFDRIQVIAQSVLNFPLPDDLEAAPHFEP